MVEEMRSHLERQAERNRAAGMSEVEARYAAQRQFGTGIVAFVATVIPAIRAAPVGPCETLRHD